MTDEIKALLNEKYGTRSPTMPWFDYTTIYTSLDQVVEDVVDCKCFISNIWEDFGVTLIEIADNNMWSGGLVVLGSYDKEAIAAAEHNTWELFKHK